MEEFDEDLNLHHSIAAVCAVYITNRAEMRMVMGEKVGDVKKYWRQLLWQDGEQGKHTCELNLHYGTHVSMSSLAEYARET